MSNVENRFLSDDSDMKIADFSSKPHRSQTANDAEEQYLLHKANGDLQKAAALGQLLAKQLCSGEEDFSLAGKECGAKLQRQLLFCFAVEVTLENALEDAVLAQAAQNAFYDAVQKQSPQFYRYLNDSGVFSFYLLAYRRGGNVEHSIGKVFAMLNDDNEDGCLAEVGETLYCMFCSSVGDTIVNQQFAAGTKTSCK
ncbi:MAG: hypothetical protein PUC59_10525 [Firmicutes bacterium]|nr:hypothetical protein [Bacillota bacterium]